MKQRRLPFLVLLVFAGTTCLADEAESSIQHASTVVDTIQTATFAGGCFWCMEPPFDKLDGVLSTTSGYTGGRTVNPSYDQVKTGRTGHIESLQVKFDSSIVGYEELLSLFWHNVDPTQAGGQFCDNGNQYRTAIFYHDENQKQLAEKTKAAGEMRNSANACGHGNRQGEYVFCCRGIPPGLLQEESDEVQVLSMEMWA